MRTAASESASALRGSGHLLSLLAVDWKGDSSGSSAAEAQCARLSEGRISPLPLADAVQALVASRDAAPLAVRALAVRVLRVHTAADSGMLLCLLLPLVQAIAHESHLPAPGPLASLLLSRDQISLAQMGARWLNGESFGSPLEICSNCSLMSRRRAALGTVKP